MLTDCIDSGSPDLVWRFPIAFQIVFALVLCIGMIWLPESPRWLLTRERYEEGETVIAALRGLEIHDRETQIQKAIIMDSIKASGYAGRKGTPLKAVFTGGKSTYIRVPNLIGHSFRNKGQSLRYSLDGYFCWCKAFPDDGDADLVSSYSTALSTYDARCELPIHATSRRLQCCK